MPSSRLSHVSSLFDLPEDYAGRQEQKEARKKHREKHEEIDVQLVLSEEEKAVRNVKFHSIHIELT
jgi:hypothetical protein